MPIVRPDYWRRAYGTKEYDTWSMTMILPSVDRWWVPRSPLRKLGLIFATRSSTYRESDTSLISCTTRLWPYRSNPWHWASLKILSPSMINPAFRPPQESIRIGFCRCGIQLVLSGELLENRNNSEQ